PFVHERVARGQEIDDVAAASQHAVDEELGFELERATQRNVMVGEQENIGVLAFYVAQEQPLSGEVRDHRCGARVGEHALDLRAQNARVVQTTVEGRLQQFVVGNAAP